jgi:dienelactone hydrolase
MGCVLLGQNTARFEIWDGMRAIDYLLSRPEVDPKRIGCTGNSGGGTQTSYLMALDDRIICAAPSCYITSLPRLLATIGPQDAEQNIFGQLANGLDHADYIMMRAPSPVLLCTATKDFFDIAGSWDSFRSAKRLYSRLGFPERISLLENDAGHNYDTPAREGVVRWMARWLLRKDEPIKEPAITLLGEEEYRCTADGKVMTLPGARSVYDLNEDEEARLLPIREAAWKAKRLAEQQDTIRRVTGIRKIADLPKPQVESLGTIARDGCTIERLAIRPEPGITLPGLFFVPQKQDKPTGVVLYLNQRGKAVDAAAGGPIEQIVQAGNAVLAVDLRGVGQTQAVLKEGGYTGEFQDAYVAYLLGRNLVGMRAEDVLVCARYAAERTAAGVQGQGGANAVRLVAVGLIGVPAFHAAALEPELFQDVMLSQTLPSWASVIHGRLNKGLVMHVVHGALQCYDLPNLAAMLGDKVTIEQPVDPTGAVVHGAPK